MNLQEKSSFLFLLGLSLILSMAFFSPLPLFAEEPVETLLIGVGRDFFDGPDSRTYLHGSTHTWEALTYLDEQLEACPWLANSWHGEKDGRVWVFQLRRNVKFHDGTPLTADIAKESILRIASHPRYDPAGVYRDLHRLEARGRYTLVFSLKAPTPRFPNVVAYYSSPIVHPKFVDADGRFKTLVGTGPFRLSRVLAGDRIVVEAFPDYWGLHPTYDRVVFRTILDAQTRAMALMAGEIDAVADVGAILPQQALEIGRAPGISLDQVAVGTTHYLLFNCRRPPFADRGARQWLAHLLNRKELVDALVASSGSVARDPFTPLAKKWVFGDLGPWTGQRPAHFGEPLVILLHAGTLERWPYRDMAQVLQARLQSAGFDATIAIFEPGAYYEAIQQGRFHMALQPNTLMTGDPDFFYAYYVASDGPRNCGCGDKEMDNLILEGRYTFEQRRRREIYRRLSVVFAENLPLLPLYHEKSLYAHGPKVARFSMDHNFRPLLVEARPAGVP